MVPVADAAQTLFARASANWDVGTTWSTVSGGGAACNCTPAAGDTVNIGTDANGPRAVTIPAAVTTATVASIAIGGTTVNGISSLTLSANTSILNVTGAVTVTPPANNNVNQLNVGAGSASMASFSITNATVNRISRLAISTGTATMTGNVTFAGTATGAQLTFSGAGTLNVGGSLGSGGTFTASTGTVVFNGAGAQTVGGAYTYNNLTVNKSAGTATLGGNSTVNGAVTITAGTLSTSASNFSLSVTGSITGAGALTGNASAISVGGDMTVTTFTAGTSTVTYNGAGAQAAGGTYTYNNLTINKGGGTATLGGNTSVGGNLTITAGTLSTSGSNYSLSVTGNITGAGTLTGNGSAIGVGGNMTVTTFTAGTSTVTYNGAGAQTAGGTYTYNNLTINKGGGSVATLGGNTTVNGALTVTAGTLTTGTGGQAVTLGVAGNFTVNDTLAGSGAITLTGAGTNIDGTGSITNTATLTISGGAKSILSTANLTFSGSITVTGVAVTNNGTVTTNCTTCVISGTGSWTNAAGSSVTVQGGGANAFNVATLTANAATNTVNYSGAAQTVKLASATYYHLTLSGSGNKTIGSAASQTLTIAGDLTISGTANYVGTTFNPAVNLAGNFNNTSSGTFSSGTGIFTFNGSGSSAQTVSGTPTFTNLTINNTGSPGGVSLSTDVTTSNQLTFTSGVVTTGSSVLITSANCSTVPIVQTSGHVAGNLRLQVPAGNSSCTHHVGDSTTYRPIALSFTSVGTGGTLTGTVTQSAGEHPNIATSQLDSSRNVNRYWTLTSGGGLALGGGSYSATFTFVAGDVDANADPLTFEVARWNGSTWTTEAAGTRTSTTTQATGITSFSDFGVGQRRLNNFQITVPASPICNPATIGITARNSSNQTLTNYRGLVNLSTSTNHGTWSVITANGTLTDTTPDDGAATYQFVVADKGSISLKLTNTHSETLTISVNDATEGVTSTSSSLQFDSFVFAISITDTISPNTTAVAGRNHAMSVQLNCVSVDTGYTGSKNLKAWVALNTDDPGGTRPSIDLGPSLPTSVPGATNVTLTFAAGVASFSLVTTDVGKYDFKLRDDSRTYSTATDIDGTSSTITTRPFALVVSAIKQGTTNNPGGTATSGSKFVAAADSFEATVGAYRYNSAVDGGNGVPSSGATLAQVTLNGTTPTYKWPTTLSASSSFTPSSGTLGSLTNGAFVAGDFSSGAATRSTLSYNEVGSFTLSGSATSFLNTGGADLTSANNLVKIFDSSGAQNAVVGRFYPDHFTVTTGSLSAACVAGGFTYMGHAGLGYTFAIEARNKSNARTYNYRNSPDYSSGIVAMQAENNNNGTDLSGRLPSPTGSWTQVDGGGSYMFTTSTATFSRPGTPDGSFDSLQIGVKVTDADGPVIASLDMNPTTSGDCTASSNCTAKSIGTTKARFGRLAIGNASGSPLIPLSIPIEAQYWNGTTFVTNTLDGCTAIAASVLSSNVALGNYTGALAPSPKCVTAISGGGTLSSGRKSLQLAAPKVSGSVDLTINLGSAAVGSTCLSAGSSPTADTPANLQYLRGGSAYNQNPVGRETFGVYRGAEEVIFMRENY